MNKWRPCTRVIQVYAKDSSFDPTMSESASPLPAAGTRAPSNKHALTGVEKQRAQLEKLLKDPSKPVALPAPPKEKTIRPPREMMKNVQGSSAGAGSGEFHVYKANRRREYERLKLMDEQAQKVCTATHSVSMYVYKFKLMSGFCRKPRLLSLSNGNANVRRLQRRRLRRTG